MVAPGGIEPPTPRFSVLCSADWAIEPKKWRFRRESNSRSSAWQADVITATPRNHLVAGAGFEPTTFGLWAQRATKLLHPAISIIIKMAEKEGFEPPRRFRPAGFQDRSLQPDLGISPLWCLRPDLNRHGIWLPQDFKSCASTNFATQAHNLIKRLNYSLSI